jgi:hypothetical protein
MPGILALGRWRQEDPVMEVRLGYRETLSKYNQYYISKW